ncbi:MAG: DUF4129 domain-containing protein [Acidobacteria bacterium]|nr:DUF4129 domain-containing protein [Acidobacteriota bacterium]
MRRPDEEPEVGSAPVRHRSPGRLLVPLVAAAAAVVVLSTAAEGPARFTPFAGLGSRSMPGMPPPVPTEPPLRSSANPVVPQVGTAVQTVLVVLAGVVALVVAALLVRAVVSAIRDRRRRPRLQGLGALEAEAAPQVADAPAVLRGIAAALVALDGEREPNDAVVRAWLGLQQAAEDAGFARAAAETPTEFTGRVLSRTGADRAALRTLLRLYLRARFGDGTISPADATGAREALRALEASWEHASA